MRPKLFQNNGQKGSSLLSILLIITLLSLVVMVVLRISTDQYRYVKKRGIMQSSAWLVEGAKLVVLDKLQKMELTLDECSVPRKLDQLSCMFQIDSKDSIYTLKVWSVEENVTFRGESALALTGPADFTYIHDGNLTIHVPLGAKSVLQGPILVNGVLSLDVDGELVFLSDQNKKCIECMDLNVMSGRNGSVSFFRLGNRGEKQTIGLVKNGVNLLEEDIDQGSDWLTNMIRIGTRKMSLPEIPTLYTHFERKEGTFKIDPDKMKKRKLVNPKLAEKDLLGVKVDWEECFPVSGLDTRRLFVADRNSSSRFEKEQSLANEGYEQDYEVKNGNLCLRYPFKKFRIRTEDCETVNQFSYGLPGNIAACEDWTIGKVRDKSEELQIGRDIEIDHARRRLIFYSPSFKAIIGKGDGITKQFSLPPGFDRNSILFVGSKRLHHPIYSQTRLIFETPPEVGAEISYYKEIPELTFQKEPLKKMKALFVDKTLELPILDLSEEDFDRKSVAVFKGDLYIRGKSTLGIDIIVDGDVYLEEGFSIEKIGIYAHNVWYGQKNPELNESAFLMTGNMTSYIEDRNEFSGKGTVVIVDQNNNQNAVYKPLDSKSLTQRRGGVFILTR